MSIQFPRARAEGLVVRRIKDECLVYDAKTNDASCLDMVADSVWQLCDGKRSIAQISDNLGAEESLVSDAVAQLSEANLLIDPDTRLESGSFNRRDILRGLGGAIAVAPMVTSVSVPPAAAQASVQCQRHNDCGHPSMWRCTYGICVPK